jgi:hypothetical protein
MRPDADAVPSSISRIPLAIALRERPQARWTTLTPPYPNAIASLAAMTRRVRSSSRGPHGHELRRQLRKTVHGQAAQQRSFIVDTFIYLHCLTMIRNISRQRGITPECVVPARAAQPTYAANHGYRTLAAMEVFSRFGAACDATRDWRHRLLVSSATIA